jgi:cell division protein ZapA
MPEVDITIGGRVFRIACEPGGEAALHDAARRLDAEAADLAARIGRLPEPRMLLMAGLMLADRLAAAEAELRALRARAERPAGIAVIPPEVADTLAELAARAEAVAAELEERLAAGSRSA